jgi:hypothetical protein
VFFLPCCPMVQELKKKNDLVKVKLSLCLIDYAPHHEDMGEWSTAPPSLSSALDGGEWSASRSGCFIPREGVSGTTFWMLWRREKFVAPAENQTQAIQPIAFLQHWLSYPGSKDCSVYAKMPPTVFQLTFGNTFSIHCSAQTVCLVISISMDQWKSTSMDKHFWYDEC